MSIPTSSADYGKFDELAEEFAARFRRGERPSLQEYIDRCPELADEIREMFPALVEVEQADEDQEARTGLARACGAVEPPRQVGDYRILREVGRGGMGVVYEAEQVSLGRRVALKVLPRHVAQDYKTLARFRREARSAAQLHHTNIVPVFEVGKGGDVSYFAMQFIQGQGLDVVIEELRRLKEGAHPPDGSRKVQRPGVVIPSGPTAAAPSPSRQVSRMAELLLTGLFAPWSPGGESRETTAALADHLERDEVIALPASDPALVTLSSPSSSVVLPGGSQLSAAEPGRWMYFRSVAQIGRQVAGGLAYAHARGIVHRDIKPSNLLLDTEGVVWISDFGLAKASDDDLTQTGDILGTVRYMAPERFQGEGDGRADVYALGLTLYELLTLRPAFDSSNRLKLIEQVKTEEPKRPRALDTQIPLDLETIVLKAIDKDPKVRYPTAAVMAEDLQRFLDDRPILARRTSYLESCVRWSRRNPGVAVLSGALLLAILAGTFLSWVLAIKSRVEANRALGAEGRAREAEGIAKAESARTRRLLYDADMRLAAEVWESEDGSPRTVRDLLEAHHSAPGLEELREFSWRYQWNLLNHGSVAFRGHKGKVLAGLAIEGLLITLDSELVLRHWDRGLRRVTFTKRLDSLPDINPRAFASQGRILALGSKSGAVLLLDAATGREIRLLQTPSPVALVAFSYDSALIATLGTDLKARIWEVASGRLRATTKLLEIIPYWRDKVARHAGLSADGKTLVLADHLLWNNLTVHDVATGELKSTLPNPGVGIQCVACSPDGRTAAWGDFAGRVGLFDVSLGQPIGEPRIVHTDRVYQLAFSPDGRYLATGGGDGQVTIQDVAGRQRARHFKGHVGPITSLAFSSNGTDLISGGQDGSTRVWDLTAYAKPRQLATADENVIDVAFSPDGRVLATGDLTARLWDPRTGRLIRTFPGPPFAASLRVAFSPDGRMLATGGNDSRVTLWEVETGRELRLLDGRNTEPSVMVTADRPVGSLAFSPDGELFAAGFGQPSWLSRADRPQKLKVWQLSSGREIRVLEVNNHVRSLTFSPDGRRLAAACRDNSVSVWDVETWRETVWANAPPTSSVTADSANQAWSVAFSADGTLLAAGFADGTVVLFDTATGSLSRTLVGHASQVFRLAFSPDGKTLASASNDKTAKLWDFQSGRELRTLRGHTLNLTSLAWAPDGDTLATAAEDRTVQLWDAASPLEVALEKGDTRAFDDLFSRDLATHPENLYAQTRRARAFLRQGRPDEAEADLIQAFKIWCEAHPARSPDCAALADELEAWKVLFPSAIFDRVTVAVSQDPDALFQAAIRERPDDPQVRMARSRAFVLVGQDARAEADLALALRLTPDGAGDRLLWTELGRFYADHHQPRMAAKALAKAERLPCQSQQMLRDWGLRSAEKQEWAKAAADFGHASALVPDDAFIARCWAQLLWQAGDDAGYRQAVEVMLDRYSGTENPHVAVNLILALVYGPGEKFDWERLTRLAQESAAREPTLPWFHHALAGAYLRSGQYEQALRCLDDSDRVSGSRPGIWAASVLNDLIRAIVHLRRGEIGTARQRLVQADQWFEQHLKADPQRPFGEWSFEFIWLDWIAFQSLRREAQSLILDASFPADPFAG
jgi:WD40 repeat protein/serine/threonine protein kinase